MIWLKALVLPVPLPRMVSVFAVVTVSSYRPSGKLMVAPSGAPATASASVP